MLSVSSVTTADGDVAAKGVEFLEKYCARCHGETNAFPGLDMRDRETLLEPADEHEEPYLVPGDLSASRLWSVVKDHSPQQMPPEDEDQPTVAEIADLKAWIEAGAEFPLAKRRDVSFVGEDSVAQFVLEDLRHLPSSKRPYARYFSMLHLWNDLTIPDAELRLTRAAVSKLINSLSSQPRIAVPTQVADGLLLRVDMRDYGWTQEHHWLNLLKAYPYGLTVGGEAADDLYEYTYCDIPYLRADWFVHAAARPALYHSLVTFPDHQGIPNHVSQLEQLLGVNLQHNFDNDRLWRAGFSESGVSDHNRIVERHDARYGYFWPSYDSGGDEDRQNFSRFPLGPKFPGRENHGAFDHDGGEFIFSLPNGLQGYMLAKATGERIDEGPIGIVRDLKRMAGTNLVVNGISCMGCHKHGMITFNDSIRPQFETRTGDIADKVRRLYPTKEDMKRMVNQDRSRFLAALDAACGSFLKQGEDEGKDVRNFAEPVTTISMRHDKKLTLIDVARELGLPADAAAAREKGIRGTASELGTIIKFSESLRRYELLPLTVDQPITRKQWESAYRAVARELGVGIPLIVN